MDSNSWTSRIEVGLAEASAIICSKFNMSLAGVNSTEIAEPANTVMFYESEPWADGSRCVSFADTHAKVVNPEEWAKLQPSLNLKLKRVGKPIPPRVAR